MSKFTLYRINTAKEESILALKQINETPIDMVFAGHIPESQLTQLAA